MRAINLIKAGDMVSCNGSIYKVVGVKNKLLMLDGFEGSGYYFIPKYFRKVR